MTRLAALSKALRLRKFSSKFCGGLRPPRKFLLNLPTAGAPIKNRRFLRVVIKSRLALFISADFSHSAAGCNPIEARSAAPRYARGLFLGATPNKMGGFAPPSKFCGRPIEDFARSAAPKKFPYIIKV